jgi:hypothetical protein
MELDELRAARKELAEVTRAHSVSLQVFQHPDNPWFRIIPEEPFTDVDVDHLSTSATCLESLADIPIVERDHPALEELGNAFAAACLAAPAKTWQSEGAAHIYCRVRTLPTVLRFATDQALEENAERLRQHFRVVWQRVSSEPGWQGVSEGQGRAGEKRGYPPHAFHTYWAIRSVREARRRNLNHLLPRDIDDRVRLASLWTEQELGLQTALVKGKSERVDAYQLAWSLATQLLVNPLDLMTRESARRDLYREGLDAFFQEQLPSGGWRLYQPLFHYPLAGNAYCYSFETLTELLRFANQRESGRPLRELLRPFLPRLIQAWRLAHETRRRLNGDGQGWSSGHHPHRTEPEAWATAMVYSFLQGLRRQVVRASTTGAARALGARRPQWPTPERAIDTLETFGQTWTDRHHFSAGARLAGMFLYPLQLKPTEEGGVLDADDPLIEESQARSAILFGPPGTGKTTLAETIAGALKWDFVEIHASSFLSAGLDRVPQQADEIFTLLMELDHCVVLFDEIDELLRERQEERSDPFGRFLTTSMLPKLARLWSQKRVIFFVATNDIKHADRAIKRSQRFDAAIYVAPPSFAIKLGELSELLGTSPPGVSWEKCHGALKGKMVDDPWGVFALLRHDQLPELAERIRRHSEGGLNTAAVENALRSMGGDLAETDWHNAEDVDPYALFLEYWSHDRIDHRRLMLAAVEGEYQGDPPPGTEVLEATVDRTYLRVVNQEVLFEKAKWSQPQSRMRLPSGDAFLDEVGAMRLRLAGHGN